MLKLPGRDGMTGAGGNSVRWNDELEEGNDSVRLDCHRRLVGDESCRSVREGLTTMLLGARQGACRRIHGRIDRTVVAEIGATDTSDLAPSRLRYDMQLSRLRDLAEPKRPRRRMLADFSTACAYGG